MLREILKGSPLNQLQRVFRLKTAIFFLIFHPLRLKQEEVQLLNGKESKTVEQAKLLLKDFNISLINISKNIELESISVFSGGQVNLSQIQMQVSQGDFQIYQSPKNVINISSGSQIDFFFGSNNISQSNAFEISFLNGFTGENVSIPLLISGHWNKNSKNFNPLLEQSFVSNGVEQTGYDLQIIIRYKNTIVIPESNFLSICFLAALPLLKRRKKS